MADVSVDLGRHRARSVGWRPPGGMRGLIVPAAILTLWWLAAHLQLASSKLLVAPQDVVLTAFVDPAGSRIWLAALQSFARMAVGFGLGASFGLLVGFVTGTAALADRALSPTLNALRQITLFAWMPLLTGWFGNGEATRTVYIALSAFFPIAFSVHEGFKRIPASYLEVAEVLRLGRRRRLTALLVPAAMPTICTGLQVGLLTAWLGTVSAEYVIGISNGLGSLIVFGREQFRMDIVLLGVLALSLVGYAIGIVSVAARRHLLKNHGVTV